MRNATHVFSRSRALRMSQPGRVLIALCCTLALAALTSCSDSGTEPQPIQAGEWSVNIDSGLTGSFTLTGNPLRLTEVHFVFNDWDCGQITYNGQVTIGTNLEIQGRDIDLTVQWGQDNDQVHFIGAFADSGDEASGTWNGTVYWDVDSFTCSGSWTAHN